MKNPFHHFLQQKLPIQAGIYQYLKKSGQAKKRIHLRIEQDGTSVLLINASKIFYFNSSATLMARSILENSKQSEVIDAITAQFDVSRKTAIQDYDSFKVKMDRIIAPNDDPCPICDLNIDTISPFSKNPSAPYRMDLALTYRCNNHCIHCYNESSRKKPELPLEKWKLVIDAVWEAGIPHIVFTGGEPTLIPFLPHLIQYAEKKGIITGINTNGRKLKDWDFVDQLVTAGLDHVQITLESHDSIIHDEIVQFNGAWKETVDGIRNVLNTHLYVMTNTTLLQSNAIFLSETLSFLSELGLPTIGLNGLIYAGRGAEVSQALTEDQLIDLLEIAKSHAEQTEQRLIWYTPTMYCHLNPIESGLGVKGCTAALYNMCVEPDGSVIPCQSYYQSLGNILSDAWDSIWNHDLAVHIRERKYIPEECRFCDWLDTCGAGCPLHLQENPLVQPQPINSLPFLIDQ